MASNKKNAFFRAGGVSRRAPFYSVFFLPRSPFLFLFLSAACCLLPGAAFSTTELGVKDDLTVLGTAGTAVDPDVEIKGFAVFGSTQAAPALNIPAARGNIFINGYVEISSGMYVNAASTFTGTLNLSGKELIGVSTITVSSITTAAAGVTFSTHVFVMNGSAGIGTANPNTKLHISSSTLTLDGAGAPAAGGALCLNAGKQLSKCTSTVDASGNCTCP